MEFEGEMGHEKFVISDNKNSLYSVQKKLTDSHVSARMMRRFA